MMEKHNKKSFTEKDVFDSLENTFASPAFILLPQVRNGVGFRRRQVRTADAMAMSVWPSRGIYFVGIEIKVSRWDWQSELRKPEKSADMQKYCKYWYVAAPAGIVDKAELPDTWGLIECGKKSKISVKAPELKCEPMDNLMVASILRKVSECTVPIDQVNKRVDDRVKAACERQVLVYQRQVDSLTKRIKEFQDASGVDIVGPWDIGNIAKAVRIVKEGSVLRSAAQLELLATNADGIARDAREAITEFGKLAGQGN